MTAAGTYQIPAGQWVDREVNADMLERKAREFLDADAGEAAWWHITGWPHSIVADLDVTTCREWLVVKASGPRLDAFYDLVAGRSRGIVSSTNFAGDRATFTPA